MTLGWKMRDAKALSEFAVASYAELIVRERLESGAMHANRVPGRSDVFFATSVRRDFYLLIKLREPVLVTENRLNSIRISSGFEFELSEPPPSEPSSGQFASVVLESEAINLLTAFSSMAGILLASLAESPSAADVEQFLGDFLDLFAPRKSIGRSEVIGLWGELWLISKSPDIETFARAWHIEPTDQFDFSFPSRVLEVKTTEGESRRHHFSLAQLSPGSRPIFIASIAMKSDAAGITIAGLLSEVLQVLPQEQRPMIARKTIAVLKGDMEAAEDFRFTAVGGDSITMVAAVDIPRVEVPLHSKITEVSFVVDISTEVLESRLTLHDL